MSDRIAELEAEVERLREALVRAKDRMHQHSSHWDRTGQDGLGCTECIEDRRVRGQIDALLRGEEAKP